MARDSAARIQDMLAAIGRIRAHIGAATYEEFSVNPTIAAAISYELLIIGEAAGRVSEDVIATHPEVPWSKLRGTRNVLVHGYFEISRSTLWETIQHDLPALEARLKSLIG